jgi:thiol-disulfide isomerase/thioredoxin
MARLSVLALLALIVAGCDTGGATATPVAPPATATTAAPPTTGATLPTAVGTVPGGAVLPNGQPTGGPGGAALPNGQPTTGTGGGDQPLPTTSPGVSAKPPTPPPGKLTLPTPVPTVPPQDLPNPEGTAGPSGPDDLPSSQVQSGDLAPDFTVTRLDTGEDVRLSDFKGRPVWINFWATWCPPCKEEMPQMQAIYEANKASDLVILGVDFREEADVVRPFVAEGKYGWTFVLDSEARAAWDYFVLALPAHIFVSRDGTIQNIVMMELDREHMEGEVADLLKQ